MNKVWSNTIKCLGWTYDPVDPTSLPYIHHCVIIMAPHTSNADFFVGAGFLFSLQIEARIFIKKESFNFFTRHFLKACGAIPVDRAHARSAEGMVNTAVKHFNENERFTLVLTPEGTRKRVKRWKRGFYQIACQANVPILLSYIDFKSKHVGIGPAFFPTGDFNADMPKIMKFYENISPKHPEKYNKYYEQ
ncbi:MAG: 1-acyl-sn-glycerol-3-phosphate acyltransferase [Bacteroidales bacterium]|nr:1-acyl-sn-glycerol-3-phosphate acyltransferase [Bacteroidales bacterium]